MTADDGPRVAGEDVCDSPLQERVTKGHGRRFLRGRSHVTQLTSGVHRFKRMTCRITAKVGGREGHQFSICPSISGASFHKTRATMLLVSVATSAWKASLRVISVTNNSRVQKLCRTKLVSVFSVVTVYSVW